MILVVNLSNQVFNFFIKFFLFILLIFLDDPFIVQDNEKKRRRSKGRKSNFNDQFLDDAKEIFGVEDIDEFYEDDGKFLIFFFFNFFFYNFIVS